MLKMIVHWYTMSSGKYNMQIRTRIPMKNEAMNFTCTYRNDSCYEQISEVSFQATCREDRNSSSSLLLDNRGFNKHSVSIA